jgi:2-keto-4-pentenoate hydratase/2-oxohepta-3-ene-1,7-dioic acid hydratase in catechol pathway
MSFGIATIATPDSPQVAVVGPLGVRPLESLRTGRAAPASLRAMLADWEGWCDAIEAALAAAGSEGWLEESAVELMPPVSDPPTLYCAGANFRDHVLEMGVPDPDVGMTSPFHFLLPPAALCGQDSVVPHPAGFEKLDWEVELAVLMGREAKDVASSDALSHVAGYTVANDLSLRDRELIVHPWFGVRWVEAKGHTRMQPLGPAIVPARFVADPMNLEMSLAVNGEVRQAANTGAMVFSIAEQIAHLSAFITLVPGDLILTGTPAGTAGASGRFLAAGDEIEATIAGLGTLRSSIGRSEGDGDG